MRGGCVGRRAEGDRIPLRRTEPAAASLSPPPPPTTAPTTRQRMTPAARRPRARGARAGAGARAPSAACSLSLCRCGEGGGRAPVSGEQPFRGRASLLFPRSRARSVCGGGGAMSAACRCVGVCVVSRAVESCVCEEPPWRVDRQVLFCLSSSSSVRPAKSHSALCALFFSTPAPHPHARTHTQAATPNAAHSQATLSLSTRPSRKKNTPHRHQQVAPLLARPGDARAPAHHHHPPPL